MAFVINDRVKETTTTTGTGALSLGGASDGFDTFATGIGNSNVTYYACVHATADEWEVGIGTLDSDSSDLTRTTVLTSSNSDSAVDFSSGTKSVFCTMPASKVAYQDNSGNFIIGTDAAGTDYNLTFRGEDNDGVFTWMEDEDYFKFSDEVLMNSTEKLLFGDTGTYIHQSADGVLDLVSDTEIEINATTIDINGAVAMDGAITGATNITLSGELDAATLDISGNADIDGTTNLDAVDIDGAVQLDATLTVGADDQGYDIKFFGDTASAYMMWDTSADDLVLAGAAGIDLAGDIDVDGTANLDNTDIDGTLAVDGTTISLDATTSLNIDNSNTSNGITIGTATSGVPISIGHTTSEVTINDNLTVTGTLTLGSGAELAEAELEMLDGITAGTVAASKAVVVDSNKDAASFRNVTLTGELDAATLDISGNADIDGTTNLDIVDIDGAVDMATTLTLGGNADFNGDLDVDGTTNLDAVDIDGAVQIDAAVTVGVDDTGYDFKLFGATSGSFLLWDESDDALELTDSSPIKIGDGGDMTIYHDGSHSYVTNATGTLKLATETSGIAITIGHTTSEVTVGDNLTVTGDLTVSGTTTTVNSTTVNLNDHNIVLDTGNSTSAVVNGAGITIEGGSGDDATFTYSTTGPKFELKLGSSYEDLQVDQLIAASLDISGDVDVDGTLEADAITVNGTTLAEFISDTAGAMVGGNTETGITVTYQDGDNTIDFALAAAQTTITSLLATDIKIGEDDETKIDFETADEIHFYAANVEQVYLGDNIFGPQSDSDVDLGSTGVRWKDAFVDSITVTGEVDGASLDISGNADIDGTLEADAITVDGTAIGSLFASQGDATALAIALG